MLADVLLLRDCHWMNTDLPLILGICRGFLQNCWRVNLGWNHALWGFDHLHKWSKCKPLVLMFMIPWHWVSGYFMLLPECQVLNYRVFATYIFLPTFSRWVNVWAIKPITVVKVKHSAWLKSLCQYAWVTLGTGMHCLPTWRTLLGQALCAHGCPHSPPEQSLWHA